MEGTGWQTSRPSLSIEIMQTGSRDYIFVSTTCKPYGYQLT